MEHGARKKDERLVVVAVEGFAKFAAHSLRLESMQGLPWRCVIPTPMLRNCTKYINNINCKQKYENGIRVIKVSLLMIDTFRIHRGVFVKSTRITSISVGCSMYPIGGSPSH
jgi:hypothetical protein